MYSDLPDSISRDCRNDEAGDACNYGRINAYSVSRARFRRASHDGMHRKPDPRKPEEELAGQTGRSRQTRSARVRETFRLSRRSSLAARSEAFFSSRLDGRVGRTFMLLSSLVATQLQPPEDRQFRSRARTKNRRAILISLFAAFAETTPGRERRALCSACPPSCSCYAS